ncbi:hypothetical protein F2Q69_00062891 [Brassica cretica]|uniref:Uncharacterized protein n=1 Tax=Brassica cretica TaxID=69181 RepID=A0A8S9RKB0_BRACR|nr:hypothetical protein F2Q69_00062891 [Brassica cretica]
MISPPSALPVHDMEEFDEADNVVENDTATLQSTYLVAHEPDDDNILRTRTNDNTRIIQPDPVRAHHLLVFTQHRLRL